MNAAASVKLLLLSGLCGDFNDIEVDDFKTVSGLIEGAASVFARTWRTDQSCVDVKPTEDSCTMNMQRGQGLSLGTDNQPFLPTHSLTCSISLFLQRSLPSTGARSCRTRMDFLPSVTMK